MKRLLKKEGIILDEIGLTDNPRIRFPQVYFKITTIQFI